jgi:hypothetical protein
MKWTETGAGTIHAAEQRFWVACGENADVVAGRMTNGPEFLDSMAQFAIRGGPQPSMGVQRAREIMGANVFGVEDGMQHMNVKFRRFELAGFAEVPATDEELEEAKETHILVAVPSISIVVMRENVAKKNVYRADNTWHLKQPFAARLGLPGWRLVRKTAVPNSTSQTWDEQRKLISAKDEVPSSRVLCYTMGGRYLQTGEKLFSDVWVRTSDVASVGLRVHVRFIADGVYVGYYWDGHRYDIIAVASARKSE